MKLVTFAFLLGIYSSAFAGTPDISIPPRDAELIKTTDYIEVSGTNDLGGIENFSIHDSKAIRQFVDFLTSDRYIAVSKNLKPKFKSLSLYKVRLFSKGTAVFELQVIADSILDIPNDLSFYMESDEYSANLMAPLLRLR
jgi:hypothetical protein